MPMSDSAAIMVARFLRSNNYHETLYAFLAEAGLPADAGLSHPGDWTIEQILEEKKRFESSVNFEKTGDDAVAGWVLPAPRHPHRPEFPITANVLCVSGDDAHDGSDAALFVTGADRSWSRLSPVDPFSLLAPMANGHGSPVLSLQPLDQGYLLSTSMSGQLLLHDSHGRLLDRRRDHAKYAVQVCAISTPTRPRHWIVATAGWDQKVHVYVLDREALDDANDDVPRTADEPHRPGVLGDPIDTITTATNPEAVLLVAHPDTGQLYLILSRRDSTFLYYYSITPAGEPSPGPVGRDSRRVAYRVHETGRQNLAPHSNAWIAFTPSCLALCPTDATLVAVATSHCPHMKLIVVRLLFPTRDSQAAVTDGASALDSRTWTQAAQARAELAVQDREDAAITLHVSTLAPQTPYSTPQVVWRPGGRGVFVNADDGVVRGVDTQTGKVVSSLVAHDAGSKVRTLYAAVRPGGDEILVSGGFDKNVFIWTASDSDAQN